jgi:hypothetical protein
MPGVGLEPTTPAFERAKTVRSLERAATVIGRMTNHRRKNPQHLHDDGDGCGDKNNNTL